MDKGDIVTVLAPVWKPGAPCSIHQHFLGNDISFRWLSSNKVWLLVRIGNHKVWSGIGIGPTTWPTTYYLMEQVHYRRVTEKGAEVTELRCQIQAVITPGHKYQYISQLVNELRDHNETQLSVLAAQRKWVFK
jgi:hypothetical protein